MMFLKNNDFNLFDELTNYFTGSKSTFMATDILEDEAGYTLTVNVPGALKENIKVSYENDYLRIEINHSEAANDKKYLCRERLTENVYRTYYLKEIDFEKAKAKLENGVLTISLPKIAKVEPHKSFIQID